MSVEDLQKLNFEASVEGLRQDIERLQVAVSELRYAGMREKTVLILLSHHTKIPQRTIKKLLDGIETLEAEYFGSED